MTAPKNHKPGSYLEALEDNLAAGTSRGSLNTQPFNYTGHPALTVPCGPKGALPVGLQLVGAPFDEATLLRIAEVVETDRV